MESMTISKHAFEVYWTHKTFSTQHAIDGFENQSRKRNTMTRQSPHYFTKYHQRWDDMDWILFQHIHDIYIYDSNMVDDLLKRCSIWGEQLRISNINIQIHRRFPTSFVYFHKDFNAGSEQRCTSNIPLVTKVAKAMIISRSSHLVFIFFQSYSQDLSRFVYISTFFDTSFDVLLNPFTNIIFNLNLNHFLHTISQLPMYTYVRKTIF